MSTRRWPVPDWETGGPVPESARSAADELFATEAPGVSLALVVVHEGRISLERHGTQPDTVFGPGSRVDHDTTLVSWSMAKSIVHCAVSLLIDDGVLALGRPVSMADWNDARAAITLDDLLRMRDGLDFVEEYVEGEGAPTPHVIEMLFGSGAADVAGYAASRPLRHRPGSVWNYSSGTTNIVARVLGDALGGREGVERFLRERIFSAIGMNTAKPVFDESGTFIGSSYVYASARDFARFGYLYLNDGLWNGNRIIAVDRIREAAESHAVDPDNGHGYGRHWWLWRDRPGVLAALGYEGQRIIVDPTRDLVVVHLGKWVVDHQRRLDDLLDRIVLAHT